MKKLGTLLEFVERVNERKQEICAAKNIDYSEVTDTHKNFHVVSGICKLLDVDVRKPLGAVEFMIIWKIHRLFKLKNSGKTPENESLFDTNVDTQVYEDLLMTIEEE